MDERNCRSSGGERTEKDYRGKTVWRKRSCRGFTLFSMFSGGKSDFPPFLGAEAGDADLACDEGISSARWGFRCWGLRRRLPWPDGLDRSKACSSGVCICVHAVDLPSIGPRLSDSKNGQHFEMAVTFSSGWFGTASQALRPDDLLRCVFQYRHGAGVPAGQADGPPGQSSPYADSDRRDLYGCLIWPLALTVRACQRVCGQRGGEGISGGYQTMDDHQALNFSESSRSQYPGQGRAGGWSRKAGDRQGWYNCGPVNGCTAWRWFCHRRSAGAKCAIPETAW